MISTNFLNRASDFNIDQKIFFLHIPKCGGTSLRLAIEDAFEFPKDSKKYDFHLDVMAIDSAAHALEKPIIELKRDVLNYSMAHKSYRYISGHFAYSEKAMQVYGDEWKYITLLRDPVSKWFSQYFYNRHKTNNHYKIDCSLEEFLVTDEAKHLGRNYIYLLVDGISSAEAATDAAINQAIINLEKFALVGVLEKLDWFYQDFQTIFGTKLKIEERNKNPLPENQQKQHINDDIRAQVEEICQPNIRIYEAAMEMIRTRRLGECVETFALRY